MRPEYISRGGGGETAAATVTIDDITGGGPAAVGIAAATGVVARLNMFRVSVR